MPRMNVEVIRKTQQILEVSISSGVCGPVPQQWSGIAGSIRGKNVSSFQATGLF